MSGEKTGGGLTHNSSLLACVVLCTLCTVAYINSFDVPFTLDDQVTIQRNPGVRFGDYFSGSLLWTRSILYLTFALNHWIAGVDLWGYHLLNLVLHILNSILVFFIAREIFRKVDLRQEETHWMSVAAAAFFLVHPVQTESVTYISSRSELLSTLFYALAFLIFIRSPEAKIGLPLAGLMVGLFLLGMGSKETVITLPITLFLYDWIFLANGSFRPLLSRWRFYGVFGGLGVAASAFLIRQWKTFFQPDPTLLSPSTYLLTQTRVILRYIRLTLLPTGLNLDYDLTPSKSVLEPIVLACVLAITAGIVLAFYWRRSHPVYSFSLLWFFITLAPTSSIIPIQDVIFEHRLYLPLLGLCLSFPAVVLALSQSVPGRVNARYVCWAIVSVLLFGTIMRNEVWRDPVRLWTDVVSKSPRKLRPYSFLATAYVNKTDYQNAIRTLHAGLDNVPDDVRWELRNILGTLDVATGRYDEAIETFRQALKGSKDPGMTYNNIGMAYLQLWNELVHKPGEFSEQEFALKKSNLLGAAEEAFRASYQNDPANLWAFDSYLNVAFVAGKAPVVKAELQSKLNNTSDFDTFYGLAKIYWLEGKFADASALFKRAIELKPDQKLVYFNNAFALDKIGQLDDAIAAYLSAIRIDPLFKEAHYNVALLYLKEAHLDEATDHLKQVLNVDPQHVPSFIGMAKIAIRRGETRQARYYLQEALRRNPQEREAAALLQSVGA
jgi:protein O-mannosyl-transferase